MGAEAWAFGEGRRASGMDVAVKTLVMRLNPEVMSQKERIDFHTRVRFPRRMRTSFHMSNVAQKNSKRFSHKIFCAIHAVSPGLENLGDSVTDFEDFTIAANTTGDGEIKMRVEVSGAETQAIFDDVFSKLVAAAQPIPGFRRVKGGKTPDIPKDILLHIIGPSKVNKESIKKIINSAVAEYVEKEGLKVTKDLKVEQSFEELEATFQPGIDFSFDAILQLQEINSTKF
ncbi:uncharacterized protein LOC103707759 isoform X1 [Phoenix dactylifera]|uniref:peptidylprolyl isomerase n=1 Tax=Phoenix dactylifera TaxID=42345 RepID=A0A8B7C2Z6_PHODC|nr:uncharacterized protein LOC103707759 isoform X1 [Phoenix dactylifera]